VRGQLESERDHGSEDHHEMGEWITGSTPYLAPHTPGERDAWASEAEATGFVGRHRLTLVDRLPAPDSVAARLGIDSGALAVVRRRLVTLDERPVEIAESWYPLAIADGTALAEGKPIRGGALRLLAELGYTAARHIEDIAVVDPPADAAEALGTSALLELIRTSYTAADEPFEVAVMLMSPEMAPGVVRRLRYELRSE
jgi:DNA-binding GntR family transcriptional regulator